MTSVAPARIAETRRPLRRILVVAALDFPLLVPLVIAALASEEAVAPA